MDENLGWNSPNFEAQNLWLKQYVSDFQHFIIFSLLFSSSSSSSTRLMPSLYYCLTLLLSIEINRNLSFLSNINLRDARYHLFHIQTLSHSILTNVLPLVRHCPNTVSTISLADRSSLFTSILPFHPPPKFGLLSLLNHPQITLCTCTQI